MRTSDYHKEPIFQVNRFFANPGKSFSNFRAAYDYIISRRKHVDIRNTTVDVILHGETIVYVRPWYRNRTIVFYKDFCESVKETLQENLQPNMTERIYAYF